MERNEAERLCCVKVLDARDLPATPTLSIVGAGAAAALRAAGQTVAASETTSGGLLAAALLAQPGASAFFSGATVAYSKEAIATLLPEVADVLTNQHQQAYDNPEGYFPSRVAWASMAAKSVRDQCGTTWGVAETGAAGPTFHLATGSGRTSGFTLVAVAGPEGLEEVRLVQTGHAERERNQWQFAAAAAQLLQECVQKDRVCEGATGSTQESSSL
ncbi:hypothetical protein CYMTET_6941 [Cymbomonas tetramitiformis]|uniref:CinA C-terminal domain-containing protein n=1 Tax=Cymbomonas tetramitiformis TaxID=36881 RepID=A0AAE0LHX7_9CHLO|nr:hypothetical protein CYMTET_6941 [Cymbomonas tetramitiformis]